MQITAQYGWAQWAVASSLAVQAPVRRPVRPAPRKPLVAAGRVDVRL